MGRKARHRDKSRQEMSWVPAVGGRKAHPDVPGSMLGASPHTAGQWEAHAAGCGGVYLWRERQARRWYLFNTGQKFCVLCVSFAIFESWAAAVLGPCSPAQECQSCMHVLSHG